MILNVGDSLDSEPDHKVISSDVMILTVCANTDRELDFVKK